MLHTMVFITWTRIYFRGETMEKIIRFYHQIWYDWRWNCDEKWLYASEKSRDFVDYGTTVFLVIIAGFLVHWVPTVYKKRIESTFIRIPIAAQLALAVITVALCYQAYSAEGAAFIYFQF
jgi:hypothetical protein